MVSRRATRGATLSATSFVCAVGCAFAGCSSGGAASGFSAPDATTDRADATADGIAVDVTVDRAGLRLEAGGAEACGRTCSSDLHQVIDCDTVVETCPPDQGCAAGACVPACQAAQANLSTIGCDYFSYNPDSIEPQNCFAAYIVNTWGSDVDITVDFNGASLTNYADFMRIPSGSGESITYTPLSGNTLPAGQVAILFLAGTSQAPDPCPVGITTALSTGDAAIHGTGLGNAFHIATTRPVVADDIYPYGGGDSALTSATLLIPSSAWGTNYVAVDGYKLGGGTPWVAIIGQTDNTDVTISPTALIEASPPVAGTGLGVPHTYTINRGQVLQFEQEDGSELNGSPIQSSQPVGVVGGSSCMDVPVTAEACDTGHQQIPPVRALGHEYVVARYRDRYPGHPESPPVRVVGAVDGTILTYDPAVPSGAPTALASRQMVEFSAGSPFVVKSQDANHPFFIAEYMTGCTEYCPDPLSCEDCRGDPEFVNVVSPQQYQSDYIFFTDPTYPETELVVVRTKNAAGTFDDVTLDCLGAPVSGWTPIDTAGAVQFARVDLVTGNFEKVGSCDNGRHEMQSPSAFGVTVWGWGSAASGGQLGDPSAPGFYSQAVSYAYPAGMRVQPITTVVVPPAPR